MKKPLLIISSLTLIGIVSSCNRITPRSSSIVSSSDESSSSEMSTSSSEPSSSSLSSSEALKNAIKIVLDNKEIRENLAFSATSYHVYHYDENGKMLSIKGKSDLTLTIYSLNDSSPYSISSSLPIGEYTVHAEYRGYEDEAFFEVIAPSIVEAEEGYCYNTFFDASDYRLDQYENMGVLGPNNTPSLGSPGVLVIPVYFSNVSAPTSLQLEVIQSAFFGESSEVGWESLRSYYEKSSYGRLSFEGFVTAPFQYNMSTDAFASSDDGNGSASSTLAKEAVSWAYAQGYDMKEVDSNEDGYIDALDLIYFTDKPADNGIWWNYTTAASSSRGTKDNPTPSRYFWSRFDMIQNGYYSPNIDTHTIIHENGHMLGLNDYYDYGQTCYPTGGTTMMEFNIGDQDAYSKFILGWVEPKVINDDAMDFRIHLDPFESSGDVILLRDTTYDVWNGTPYDEYLLLQYYTPTGLNEKDSNGYPEWSWYGTGGMFEISGLQVFHVDSRAAEIYGTGRSVRYTDSPLQEDGYSPIDGLYVSGGFIPASNTPSQSMNVPGGSLGSPFKQIELIPADASTKFQDRYGLRHLGEASSLYTSRGNGGGGSLFSMEKMSALFPNGELFNDESTLGWQFEVEYNDEYGCDLLFSKTN